MKSNAAAMALIAVAAIAAYSNTLSAPFVLDDYPTIQNNPTIRTLWPLSGPLSPPKADGITVGGRPLVNLTLAANYAASGTRVASYHAANLAIHILAAFALFGIVRRTLQGMGRRGKEQFARGLEAFARRGWNAISERVLARPWRAIPSPLHRARPEVALHHELPGPREVLFSPDRAWWAALAVALVWVLHPLQTSAVTYLAQRAESLAGLFYLLTLYCFIRATAAPSSSLWPALSIAACALGMASKEVMVSAPLVAWLYDRTFVAGTFREAWRRRRQLYAGLFATWVLLAHLVAGTAGRGGTAGWNTQVTWWAYALTQCEAVVRYLRLSLWPDPLVFDYGMRVVSDPLEVVPQGVLLFSLLAATAIALARRPELGFAGAAFFALLAPSSSVIPVATQTMAEHRMYLPLALVVTVVVVALHRLLGRRAVLVCFAWAAGLGWLTFERNRDYQSELALWADTVEKLPSNARARSNLGKALLDAGRADDAFAQLTESLRLGPELPAASYNLGLILGQRGRKAEARARYEAAVRLNPRYAEARVNLGVAMLESGEVPDGLAQLEAAVALVPDLPEAQCNLGNALAMSGRFPEAIPHFEEALRLKPDYVLAHANYASWLRGAGHLEEARRHLERALALSPTYAAGHYELGLILFDLGRPSEAAARFEETLRLQPTFRAAREALGRIRK